MKSRVYYVICMLVLVALIGACSPAAPAQDAATQVAPEATAVESSDAETETTPVEEPAAAESSEPVTITWWVPNWDEEVATVLIDEFEAQYPNIKVEVVITTWDTMEGQIRTALNGNNAPDVITDLESRVASYASQGLLANLDSYYTASNVDMDDFFTSAIDLATYDGSLYAMPMRHDGPAMIYNKDMFEEAGLDPDAFPATWDELNEVAKLLTKDTDGDGTIDQYGIGWPLGNEGNAVVRFYQMAYNFGGSITNEEGTQCELNSEAGKQAMEYLNNNLNVDEVTPHSALEVDNTGLRNLFINKKIAIYSNGAFDIPEIQSQAPDINIGTATYPGNGDGIGLTIVNGFSLYIPENAKNKDAAWELLNFIGLPENSGRLTTTFPARRSAMSLEKFSEPLFQPFIEQMDSGRAGPTFVNWPSMQTAIFAEMQEVMINGKDVDQALNDMCAEVDQLLAQ
ncbi:MAG: ABC transporter substrate-binding protein [Anaerolineaceae bacterium]|nr:ABC transporter substrate-binding protein [Anaerolineaceae bacterium]